MITERSTSTASEAGPDKISLKIVLLGDSGTGKSKLAKRYTKNTYSEGGKSTEGLEFSTKNCQIFGKMVKVQVWDCAGLPCPESKTKAYFKGAVGAVIVYDVNNRDSFDNIQKVWLKQLHAFGLGEVNTLLVANKSDLSSRGAGAELSVTTEEANTMAQVLGLPLASVSAKLGTSVTPALDWLVYSVMKNISELAAPLSSSMLPEGWVLRHTSKDSEQQEYFNMFTGKSQLQVPMTEDRLPTGPVVRVPSSMVRKVEKTLQTRHSFSITTSSQAKSTSTIYDFIPKCCTMS